MWILKVCTQMKPKISVPWHWNSVNEASMLLTKYISKNFTKKFFSLRNITKIVSDQLPVIPTQPIIFKVKSSQNDKLFQQINW